MIEAALAQDGDLRDVPGLPEELLSIIVDTDFSHDLEEQVTETSRRQMLDGYLMSWSLIFIHFAESV